MAEITKIEKVQIEMEGGGIIKLELYPDAAPITVKNFEKLVREGFYNGLIFHRVIEGFMIQGGDPTGTGMGGAEEKIKGEFKQNGWDNPIKHTRGVISMARSMMKDSASSQFFIMHKDAPHLDGSYAAFGKVVEGMETVDAIAEVETDYSDRPRVAQVMKSVTIE
jgi:peptidyl-prolyl cis-trans isomerase B (cyclophilin B)